MEQPDVDAADDSGVTLLMLAARMGSKFLVEQLLEAGAKVNATSKVGQCSPLTMASDNGRVEVVQVLLDKRADCQHAQKDGLTALVLACRYGHLDVAKLILRERMLSIDQPGPRGTTALLVAAGNGHSRELIHEMLAKKACVDAQREDGWSALMLASRAPI